MVSHRRCGCARGLALGFLCLCLCLPASCASLDADGALVPPTADEDPALPQIEVEVAGARRSVHLETFGAAGDPVVLVLHGSLSDYRALRLLEALSDRHLVVMWDRRGNGLSERIPASEYTLESVVEEIAFIKNRFSPDRRVTLIGHSFGAMFAALYTSRHPDHVEQAVLMEPAGLNGQIFGDNLDALFTLDLLDGQLNDLYWQTDLLTPADHETLDYKAVALLQNGAQLNYFCDPEHPPRWPIWRPGAHVELVRNARLSSDGVTFDYDFARGLDAFPREVLILGSSCSALGYDFQVRHHAPLFMDARVERIDEAGHRLVTEAPDAVLDAIRGYLEAYRP